MKIAEVQLSCNIHGLFEGIAFLSIVRQLLYNVINSVLCKSLFLLTVHYNNVMPNFVPN
jgi:hypothetical protein